MKKLRGSISQLTALRLYTQEADSSIAELSFWPEIMVVKIKEWQETKTGLQSQNTFKFTSSTRVKSGKIMLMSKISRLA